MAARSWENVFTNFGGTFAVFKELQLEVRLRSSSASPKQARVLTDTVISIPVRTGMLFGVNVIDRFTFKPSKHITNLSSTS
jgi:hypothetical protein